MPERKSRTASQPSQAQTTLDTFVNAHPARDYLIHIQIPEFTCHCPLTGQPDFAHFTIEYIADELCIELKALKMYMWSFRDIGAFHEKVTNDVLNGEVREVGLAGERAMAGELGNLDVDQIIPSCMSVGESVQRGLGLGGLAYCSGLAFGHIFLCVFNDLASN